MFTKRTLPAMLFVWATAGGAHANVVVDMSLVQGPQPMAADGKISPAPLSVTVWRALPLKVQPSVQPQGRSAGGQAQRRQRKVPELVSILAAGRNSRERRNASANATTQKDQIVKNCMIGRGYNVLN